MKHHSAVGALLVAAVALSACSSGPTDPAASPSSGTSSSGASASASSSAAAAPSGDKVTAWVEAYCGLVGGYALGLKAYQEKHVQLPTTTDVAERNKAQLAAFTELVSGLQTDFKAAEGELGKVGVPLSGAEELHGEIIEVLGRVNGQLGQAKQQVAALDPHDPDFAQAVSQAGGLEAASALLAHGEKVSGVPELEQAMNTAPKCVEIQRQIGG
ncbi:hypothetical protein KCV87_19095 [Actinosynnema pretiosum subsp. pretiosum]|uniref:Lipoprotein n=2 Tax=Actinosynnema TaxID=40566 RepID=C6WFC4_ACTMD|nr:hypothetical protein [Actinosynnema mirum]ACU34256.1 hypothetical protein Amir_0287 [Actinosynnema mirum DSM 43827]AXX27631.1 hypothetical protein APASM_0266 [Actinosynnema pretiosum subsp. pretiosum]QUF01668.1 hypothetical protein KCV87_19095 [Actinosynnema pretiosum subsp. pretiosum]